MRQITRRVTLALLAAIVLLLALGALPGYLKSGDPYYMTATATDNRTAIPADSLSDNRYPYTAAALANATAAAGDGTANATGRSEPYWKGPVGLKGAFTHSPFDEFDAVRQRNQSGATDSAIFVRENGTVYRLEVTQTP
ncbi:hypothetical protein [Halorientalis regularis]|jgi:hypothetical protein|uniref:Uncharacterized protein n=1 Tax=Halorientalis regularis TaxID=660518 RepID=A0A1G7L1M4_9EURY|nr:hypothetical protein [Halorientalis regularis]SDF43407.1 hypothetical protein SAMN05216218_106126 [Halorientalis regularis]